MVDVREYSHVFTFTSNIIPSFTLSIMLRYAFLSKNYIKIISRRNSLLRNMRMSGLFLMRICISFLLTLHLGRCRYSDVATIGAVIVSPFAHEPERTTQQRDRSFQKLIITAIETVLWPNDAIWRQISGSTLAQLMASCMTASSHYLNQC